MGLAHQSLATINSPEFINLTPLDINPLMSACEIKVFYIGENRNGSYISKQVATEMAKTLRGAPIVGYYKENKEDFTDHGEKITWDDEGIHFECLTKPYGFVAPDAKVWFKDFEDKDDFGNTKIRTYLMTTGYLWTGQFEEADLAIKEGRPHSMELDEKTVKGKWAQNSNSGLQFFIINDAIFSKLCILGEDVEPCFEGSGITAPEISSSFSLDENFKHTLFTMMEELKYALKGGNTMAKETQPVNEVEIKEPTTEFTEEQMNENESSSSENAVENPATEFEKKDDKQDEKKDAADDTKEDDDSQGDDGAEKKEPAADEDDDEEKKKKFTMLEEKYEKLQSEFSALEEEVKVLREYKNKIEEEKKDELIKDFYMLSDEDKKEVIENKSNYTYDEIKAKLAVICFEKKVNFNLDTSLENEESIDNKETENVPITTFNIKDTVDSTPDWVKAVESTMNNI